MTLLPPAQLGQLGLINSIVVHIAGRLAGTEPPRLFRTIGHRPALLRRWLLFAGTLMPGGSLPRVDTEIVILGVAALLDCDYEWRHHEPLARRAGATDSVLGALRATNFDATSFTPRQRLLLAATRALVDDGRVNETLMAELRAELGDAGTVELLMLIGHYQMLAGFIASCRLQPDRRRNAI